MRVDSKNKKYEDDYLKENHGSKLLVINDDDAHWVRRTTYEFLQKGSYDEILRVQVLSPNLVKVYYMPERSK